jgi:hypothetical protein
VLRATNTPTVANEECLVAAETSQHFVVVGCLESVRTMNRTLRTALNGRVPVGARIYGLPSPSVAKEGSLSALRRIDASPSKPRTLTPGHCIGSEVFYESTGSAPEDTQTARRSTAVSGHV